MKHEAKKRMARRMRTPEELRHKVSIFQTEAWEKRKYAKEIKLEKKKL